MQHKGEIIEKAVRASGYPISKLAKKLGKSRKWMYLQFENQNVSIDYIIEIGEIIHYDFLEEINELRRYKNVFNNSPLKNKVEDVEYWKDKYLKLLEKHNLLITQKIKDYIKTP